jgi:hypothetical protein
MATRYVCDRCGGDGGNGGLSLSRDVVLTGWKGDGTGNPLDVNVNVVVALSPSSRQVDDDADLCFVCKLEALAKAITAVEGELRSARDAAALIAQHDSDAARSIEVLAPIDPRG